MSLPTVVSMSFECKTSECSTRRPVLGMLEVGIPSKSLCLFAPLLSLFDSDYICFRKSIRGASSRVNSGVLIRCVDLIHIRFARKRGRCFCLVL